MFTPRDRDRIRDGLVRQAEADDDIVGAALVGSAARGAEDEWSDIDLALQLATEVEEPRTVARWTAWMSAEFGVADTYDVIAAGGVRYRVFLLSSSLQIDVSFWPRDEFRATEPGFLLLFGDPRPSTEPAAPRVDDAIGLGWLHALHTRSAIARGRGWQAQLMLDDLRNAALTLRCVEHGLNPWHGREVDRLPAALLAAFASARAREVTTDELRRSLGAHAVLFLDAVAAHDSARGDRLADAIRIIAGSA